MMNITKTARYLEKVGVASIATAMPLGLLALPALATDGAWGVNDMLNKAQVSGNLQVQQITGSTINARVSNITGWLLGVAIAIFVLRVVMTAIDRMVLGGEDQYGNQRTVLSAIPLIGAYPPPSNNGGYTWKDVWINFAKNLAIVVGAWVLVTGVVGLVQWAMNAFTGSGTNNG